MEEGEDRGHRPKKRGRSSTSRKYASKDKKKKKAKTSAKDSKKEQRKRKREGRTKGGDEHQQPAHAHTAKTTTKREKVAKRLFAAISRCGSGRAASSTGTGTDAAVALHDVRYYTTRLIRLAAPSADPALVVDDTGRTPLHRAVLQDNAALCRYLIDALGQDVVNLVAGSEDASTALHYACLNGNAEICYMLYRSGAESDIKNALGIAATEIGFESLRKRGEELEVERQQREAEWRARDERIRATNEFAQKRDRSSPDRNHGGSSKEGSSDDDGADDRGEDDCHIYDYTEMSKGRKKKRRERRLEADCSDKDAFERWKEMERNKWRRQQEEQDWNARLAEEFASETGGQWHDQWADMEEQGGEGAHLNEEEWKDWVRKEMARKASRRWGQDHTDFYDAKARKRREEQQKDRERREREKERETKERVEREEKEKEAQRQKVEAKRQADDWKRLEQEWAAFEEALNARRKEETETSDLGTDTITSERPRLCAHTLIVDVVTGFADIPFPDIERDEETGHTLGGFNFLTEDTTADDKVKFLRTLFLRWHPDKFEQRVGHRLKPEERVEVLGHATRITQHVTRLKDLLAKQTPPSATCINSCERSVPGLF